VPGTVKVAVVFTFEGSANSTGPGPLTLVQLIIRFSAGVTSSRTESRSSKMAAVVTSPLAPTLGPVFIPGVEGLNVVGCSGVGIIAAVWSGAGVAVAGPPQAARTSSDKMAPNAKAGLRILVMSPEH
jgi:hypothetical protein